MKIIIRLLVAAWIAAPDFGSGLMMTFFWNKIFHRKPSLVTYLVGLVTAVSPDSDLALAKIQGKGATASHREGLHKPLLIIPIWLVLRCFSKYYANLAASVLLSHFVDDVTGESDAPGVSLMWPFSQKYFCVTSHGLEVRSPEEVRNKLDLSYDDAVKRFYLCWPPRPKAVFSLVYPIFALALVVIDWRRNH